MANIVLSPLHRADGSAKYSENGCTVIAAVNGPIEVQRRDELPEEATVDVAIRPVSGLGGIRERHLESIIQNTLRHIILVAAHPRTLIQITLLITASQEDESSSSNLPQAASNLLVLPALLQASILALLSTSIPLSTTLTATLIAVGPNAKLVPGPSSPEIKTASSLHVLAFTARGDLLIVESEGNFRIDTWEEVYEKAILICHGHKGDERDDEDVSMDSDNDVRLEDTLRDAVQENFARERKWKESLG